MCKTVTAQDDYSVLNYEMQDTAMKGLAEFDLKQKIQAPNFCASFLCGPISLKAYLVKVIA